MKTNNGRYTLNGKTPVPCNDLMEWATWFEKAVRSVAVTDTKKGKVSTVFLALDHNFGGGGPILFETMVFGGDRDGDCERYETWEQAEAGHVKMVEAIAASSVSSV